MEKSSATRVAIKKARGRAGAAMTRQQPVDSTRSTPLESDWIPSGLFRNRWRFSVMNRKMMQPMNGHNRVPDFFSRDRLTGFPAAPDTVPE
jgi:hypothetical protein